MSRNKPPPDESRPPSSMRLPHPRGVSRSVAREQAAALSRSAGRSLDGQRPRRRAGAGPRGGGACRRYHAAHRHRRLGALAHLERPRRREHRRLAERHDAAEARGNLLVASTTRTLQSGRPYYAYELSHSTAGVFEDDCRQPLVARACMEGLASVGGWPVIWRPIGGEKERRAPTALDVPLAAREAVEPTIPRPTTRPPRRCTTSRSGPMAPSCCARAWTRFTAARGTKGSARWSAPPSWSGSPTACGRLVGARRRLRRSCAAVAPPQSRCGGVVVGDHEDLSLPARRVRLEATHSVVADREHLRRGRPSDAGRGGRGWLSHDAGQRHSHRRGRVAAERHRARARRRGRRCRAHRPPSDVGQPSRRGRCRGRRSLPRGAERRHLPDVRACWARARRRLARRAALSGLRRTLPISAR